MVRKRTPIYRSHAHFATNCLVRVTDKGSTGHVELNSEDDQRRSLSLQFPGPDLHPAPHPGQQMSSRELFSKIHIQWP